ncbi:DUF4150 domain-containing protein [Rhizobium sp. ZPR3]|uniref:DUF4150 domain-containing protein n=2 Tax=unclassified Rhizobium TaxID=2613769 RepID=A0AAU7SQP3_9HYPH
MRETVGINGLTLCHKHSDGFTRSTLPDVCRSPQSPVPYTNVAYARDLADGTTTVFSHGGAMNGVKGSKFAISFGDEPGVGLGVKSGTVQAEATWLSWSPNVFMEGRAVTRLTDKMLMNHGNTISAGGYYTGKVEGEAREVLEKMCEFACKCKAEGKLSQACIDDKMQAWADETGRNVTPNGAYEKGEDGKWQQRLDDYGNQTKGGPKGHKRPDYTDHDNNTFGENKLPGDRYRGKQDEIYDQIEEDTEQKRHDLNFKDCDCNAGEPSPVTQPATKPEESGSFRENHPYIFWGGVGVATVGAGALTWWAGGSGGAAVLALFGVGGTTMMATQ